MREKKHPIAALCKTLAFPLAAVLILACFTTSLTYLQSGREQEGKRQLEDALRRTTVACYAAEGIYPPTVAYMQERYGLQVDETRYAVFYEIFADNLMPNITVVELTS